MKLTYSRMHRKLAFAAAAVWAVVVLHSIIQLVMQLFQTLDYWDIYTPQMRFFFIVSVITRVLHIFCHGAMFVMLLRAKKDTLCGIVLLLPVATTILISIPVTIAQYAPALYTNDYTVNYVPLIVIVLMSLSTLLFRGALGISCFTRGRLFGETMRPALVIVTVISLSISVLNEFSGILTVLLLKDGSLPFIGSDEYMMLYLKESLLGLLRELPYLSAMILTALSFLRPGRELCPQAEEN